MFVKQHIANKSTNIFFSLFFTMAPSLIETN